MKATWMGRHINGGAARWIATLGVGLAALSGCSGEGSDTVSSVQTEERLGSAESALSCLILQRGTAGTVEDTHIAFDPVDVSAGNTNFGAVNMLHIGAVGSSTRQALVKFDLSTVPAGATIQSATLSLRKSQSPGQGLVDLHRITAPWSETTVTWNTFGGGSNPTAELTINPSTVPIGGYLAADVTSLVSAWYSGTLPNDGMLLAETGAGRLFVGSSDAGLLQNQPSLSVCYLPAPTCSDGIQNGSEAGVDCGGTCAPCCTPSPEICDGLDNDCNGQVDEDGFGGAVSCSDGDACTLGETCQSGVCGGASPVTCSASDQCHAVGTCDSSTGSCDDPPVADGASCDDGDPNTSNEVCSNGVCAGGGVGPATCTVSPSYSSSVITMDTKGDGGGFSPHANEYWYPEFPTPTIHRYSSSYQYLGSFNNPSPEYIMQLWGDTDGSYYVANWGYNTVQKISGMNGSVVWVHNHLGAASGVAADANYVYAMNYYNSTVTVLDKTNGAVITYFQLYGGSSNIMIGGLAVAGGKLYRGDVAGLVDVYDLTSHSLLGSFQTTGQLLNMSFTGTDYCVSTNNSSVYCYGICM